MVYTHLWDSFIILTMTFILKPILSRLGWVLVILTTITIVGCRGEVVSPQIDFTATAPTPPIEPVPTPTITPLPEPLAVRVNEEGVLLVEYEAQMVQLQQADLELGIQRSPEEQRQMVIDELVIQALLSQGAQREGFRVNDAMVQARLDQLMNQTDGPMVFLDWAAHMGYTPESIRTALERSIEAAWQRDRILAAAPATAEQVKARQILVRFQETAQNLYRRLEAGADFATLALQYDGLTGGDLGWFPRGYLTVPEVEEAAFNLQAGEYSPIIATTFGYHIVQVIEREENQPLSPDARLVFQLKALEDWLANERNNARIEILVP